MHIFESIRAQLGFGLILVVFPLLSFLKKLVGKGAMEIQIGAVPINRGRERALLGETKIILNLLGNFSLPAFPKLLVNPLNLQ